MREGQQGVGVCANTLVCRPGQCSCGTLGWYLFTHLLSVAEHANHRTLSTQGGYLCKNHRALAVAELHVGALLQPQRASVLALPGIQLHHPAAGLPVQPGWDVQPRQLALQGKLPARVGGQQKHSKTSTHVGHVGIRGHCWGAPHRRDGCQIPTQWRY